MTHPHIAHGDPALQPERTALAWDRTILAIVIVGLFFLRLSDSVGAAALAPLVLGLSVAVWLRLERARRLHRAARGIVLDRGLAGIRSVLIVGLATCALALAGMLVVVVSACG